MLIATAVATTLFAPQAFAQAKNFQGFSVGLNLDWVKAAPTQTNLQVDEESSANLGLEAQYNFAIGNQFTLGVGATIELTKPRAGTAPSTNVSSKALSATSVYVKPGIAISESLLVYGKIASVSATVDYSNGASDQTYSGLGYGIGVQNMLSKNWLVQAEVLSSKYDAKTFAGAVVVGGKVTTLSIGVGYKF